MQDLSVSLIQTDLHWDNPDANLAMLEEKIWKIKKKTDLIVLPEMFNTGFSMNTALAEPMNSKTMRWMKQMAAQTQAAVVGSLMIKEGAHTFNRLIFMKPDGSFEHYDKRHLFRLGSETEHYTPGKTRKVVQYKRWNILLTICYDLRFPVWSRNRLQADGQWEYDILINVANWPFMRIKAWDTLLQARAIENLSYVVACNRVGKDTNGIDHVGHSSVIDARGEYLFFRQDWEKIATTNLSAEALAEWRKKFPFGLDADRFQIEL